jgi:hypothetical protein
MRHHHSKRDQTLAFRDAAKIIARMASVLSGAAAATFFSKGLGRSILAGQVLARHAIRRHAVMQNDEFRLAQKVHVGPTRVLDLGDQVRFQRSAFG